MDEETKELLKGLIVSLEETSRALEELASVAARQVASDGELRKHLDDLRKMTEAA